MKEGRIPEFCTTARIDQPGNSWVGHVNLSEGQFETVTNFDLPT